MPTVLKVDGMSCQHCVKAVEDALYAIDGVSGVKVDLAEKTVRADHAPTVSIDALKAAIEDQGFDVVN